MFTVTSLTRYAKRFIIIIYVKKSVLIEVNKLSDKNNCCKKTSIGGQALIEGIMMRGPQKTVMAVRDPAGEIVLEACAAGSAKKSNLFKIPIIRGVFSFIDSMKTGYKALMRSAEIAMPEDEVDSKKLTEEDKKKESKLMGIAAAIGGVLGVALSVVLFIWMPSFLFSIIRDLSAGTAAEGFFANTATKSLFEGILKLALFVGYIALMCLVKDVRRTFQYHGAEHKTIFAYEAGLELTVENIRPQRRFHPRCGTSFMILMIIVGIFIGMLIPETIGGVEINHILRAAIKLLLLPLTMGIGYELIKLCGRHDNVLTRIIAAPGVWLQHLTVHEPDDKMIECAIAAMEAVIPENKDADKF